MIGTFNPKKHIDVLPESDKKLIGTACEWTTIGIVPRTNEEYGGQRMLAPRPKIGFTFRWTPEEDVDVE